MEQQKIVHFIYIPFTGLGLYNGYRGDRWLKNRIQVFKQFVVPSLIKKWEDNMVLWISWRHEEIFNPQVKELRGFLNRFPIRCVFTYDGVCFYDDKYDNREAIVRLFVSLNDSLVYLQSYVRGKEEVLMTIQPSDDVYLEFPKGNEGWAQGYIMNYVTGEMAEYNPTTTPPFFTISFKPEVFLDPYKHMEYTGPYKSHEYVKDYVPMNYINKRGFIVGVHGENISTGWDIPFKGKRIDLLQESEIVSDAGIWAVGNLEISRGWRRTLFFKLPHRVRRKLRYWLGERFYAKIHKYVTNH